MRDDGAAETEPAKDSTPPKSEAKNAASLNPENPLGEAQPPVADRTGGNSASANQPTSTENTVEGNKFTENGAGGGEFVTLTMLSTVQSDLRAEILKLATATAARDEGAMPASKYEFSWRALLAIRLFFSSGIFFIILGGATLFLAYKAGTQVHSAYTFVLVVLGVAIVLYGTGTQGMGQLNGGNTAAKYQAAIAGGAGLLAFAVAWGIVVYSDRMKTAFQVEQRYVRIPIHVVGNNQLVSDWYMWDFSIDGMGIPTARRGNYLEILVPYRSSDFSPSAPDAMRLSDKGKPATSEMQKAAAAKSLARMDALPVGTPGQVSKTIRANYQLTSNRLTSDYADCCSHIRGCERRHWARPS